MESYLKIKNLFIKVDGNKVKNIIMVNFLSKINKVIKEHFKMIKGTELANNNLKMAIFMKVNINLINFQEKEFIYGQMVLHTKVNF